MVKVVLTDKQAEWIDDRTRHLMIMGSAGSGKTWFACFKVILYGLTYENAQIGVFRKTMPSLKKTSWKVIESILKKYGIAYKINKSDGIIVIESTGSEIMFIQADDDEKLRSLTLDFVYIEQAEELTYDEYSELNLRIRGEVYRDHWGQMLVVVQPSSKSHWLYILFYQLHGDDPAYKKVHFSYLENPYLPEDQLKQYEDLKKDNYDKYRTHTLGEWITSSKQIFIDNWSVGIDRNSFNFYVGGVDFGWNVPSAFLLIGFYDNEAYVLDEVYAPELTNSEFIRKINEVLDSFGLDYSSLDGVYCDSASPDRIEVLSDEGLPCFPSVKDVKAKIDTTRETKIHISKRCVNLIREMPNYQYKKDKNGNVLDEPVKENDHAVDALCYAVYGVRGSLSRNKPPSDFDKDMLKIY